MSSDAANAPRCLNRSGTYEAWYVTVADPASARGFWLRYTTLNPASGVSTKSESALWAFAFDRNQPRANWGGKMTFPLRALQTTFRPFGLRLDGARLERDGCSGQVHTERGSMRWDLSWKSREPPFPFLRPRWQGLSSVANIGARILRVTITPRREDLIGVTYSDPRGGNRFCYHTEVADLDLRMTRGAETIASIARPASAAFEYASDIPLAGVPLRV